MPRASTIKVTLLTIASLAALCSIAFLNADSAASAADSPSAAADSESTVRYLSLPDAPRVVAVSGHHVKTLKGGVSATGGSVAPRSVNPRDPAVIRSGKNIMETRSCLACHSIKGFGGHLAPRLDGIAKRHDYDYVRSHIDDAELFIQPDISKPDRVRMMPSGLTPDQCDRIAAYLMTLK